MMKLHQGLPPGARPHTSAHQKFLEKQSRGTCDASATVVEHFMHGMWREDAINRRCAPVVGASDPFAFRHYPLPYVSSGIEECICTYLISSQTNRSDRNTYSAFAWSRDGRRLIVGSTLGELAVFGSSLSFESVKRIPSTEGAVASLDWARNASLLAMGDSRGVVHLCSSALTPLKDLKDLHGHSITDTAFGPHNLKLAACGLNGYPVVWDLTSFSKERDFTEKGYDVVSLDWHPTDALILTGGSSGTIHMWDPREPRCIHTIIAHKSPVKTIRIAPCGRLVATASPDGLLKVWDVRSSRELKVAFREPADHITSIDWNPVRPNLCVTGNRGGGFDYWDVSQVAAPESVAVAKTTHKDIRDDVLLEPLVSVVGCYTPGGATLARWHPLALSVATVSPADNIVSVWSRYPEDIVGPYGGAGRGSGQNGAADLEKSIPPMTGPDRAAALAALCSSGGGPPSPRRPPLAEAAGAELSSVLFPPLAEAAAPPKTDADGIGDADDDVEVLI